MPGHEGLVSVWFWSGLKCQNIGHGIRAVHVVENGAKIGRKQVILMYTRNPLLSPGVNRTLFIPLAPPFHGTTALFTLLMSHPEVATLCRAGAPQCEG